MLVLLSQTDQGGKDIYLPKPFGHVEYFTDRNKTPKKHVTHPNRMKSDTMIDQKFPIASKMVTIPVECKECFKVKTSDSIRTETSSHLIFLTIFITHGDTVI